MSRSHSFLQLLETCLPSYACLNTRRRIFILKGFNSMCITLGLYLQLTGASSTGLFVLLTGRVTWLLPRTVLLEHSGHPGYALRSGQAAAKRNKEHNMDLCPSQIVGQAGQWSGPWHISASVYLSSKAEQKKTPGSTHSGKRLCWTSLLTGTGHPKLN